MSITTDPNRIKADDPGDPEKDPIFTYMEHMEYDESKLQGYIERYRLGTIGDVELKKIFLEFFMDYFADFRTKRATLQADRDAILDEMRTGAKVAREVAQRNMVKIREGIGSLVL